MDQFCLLRLSDQNLASIYRWSYKLHDLSYNNSGTSDRISMKFGMEVMPLEAGPNSYALISHNE
jgi:hypothetical protein